MRLLAQVHEADTRTALACIVQIGRCGLAGVFPSTLGGAATAVAWECEEATDRAAHEGSAEQVVALLLFFGRFQG